jgi:guanylate kinase
MTCIYRTPPEHQELAEWLERHEKEQQKVEKQRLESREKRWQTCPQCGQVIREPTGDHYDRW